MNRELSVKPKLSRDELQAQKAVQLQAIRLRAAIYRALDDRGITTSAAVGAALGLPAEDATRLLNRKHLRVVDFARLEAAAARLEL